MNLGWPDSPYPLLGKIKLNFNMEKNEMGVEHAGLRFIQVFVKEKIYTTTINDESEFILVLVECKYTIIVIGAPIGQSFFCNTGFHYRLCPVQKPVCNLNREAATLKFTDVRFQPFQIESRNGFDTPTYCISDMKVIFPAFISIVALVVASILGVYLYQTKRQRISQENIFREL